MGTDYTDALDFIDSPDEDTADENILKYRLLLSRHQSIENKLASGWTHAKFCAQLKNKGMDIPLDTFRTYLYRMRSAPGGKERMKKARNRKLPAPPASDKEGKISPSAPGREDNKCDVSILELEKAISKYEPGYKVDESIRNYVVFADNRVVRNFDKGHRSTSEQRDAIAGLRRVISKWNLTKSI